VPLTQATTIYQQFSDSSGEVELSDTEPTLIGSFTVSQSINIVPAEIQFVSRGDNAVEFCPTPPYNFFVATSSDPSEAATQKLVSFSAKLSPYGQCLSSASNVANFGIGTSTSLGNSAISTYVPGVVYRLYGDSGISDQFVTTNLSRTFLFGYLTGGGFGPTLTIDPGIPGYTDVGIATTSQQAYCYSNFSTSTGLLDSLGQSISLGACNAFAFLFVPSTNAVGGFAQLASTTESKIPFSYFFDIKNTINALTASSTTNLPTYTVGLGSLQLGSTTSFGNVLPNLTVLSSTTVDTYMPNGIRVTLLALGTSAIWLIAGMTIYRRIVPHKAI